MGCLSDDDVAEAYRRYFPIVLRKSRRMLRGSNEAQDLAQETFLRLWESRLDLRDARATTAWLYSTCTRLAIDRLRSPARRSDHVDEGAEAIASREADAEDRSHHRHLLYELAGVLPAPEMEAAVLSRVDGLNHQEIAQVLDVGERTVRRLLARADGRITRWRATRELAT